MTLVDIAPTPVQLLQQQLGNKARVLLMDFFELKGQFDYILEQTFFCALDPKLRPAYVQQMHQLLAPGGRLAGVLFNRSFDGGPPFGGSTAEDQHLFAPRFHLVKLEPCYNSIPPRQGTELFMIAEKKQPSP